MNELYTYRCSFCKTVAIATMKMSRPPLQCKSCLRIMAYLYATPVSAEEWQARNLNPPVFRSPHDVAHVAPEDREKRCDGPGCRESRPKRELFNGRFCSEACGSKHSAEMEAYWQRIEAMRTKDPWLQLPRKQEIA